MKNEFKKGDRVVCVDESGSADCLEIGKTYTVLHTREYYGKTYLFLEEVSSNLGVGWFTTRFKKASQETSLTRKPTRYDQVLNHLLAGHSLTQGEAIMLGYGMRLAATVHTLKKRGHNIVTKMKTDSNGYDYAEYSLVTRNSRNGNLKRS